MLSYLFFQGSRLLLKGWYDLNYYIPINTLFDYNAITYSVKRCKKLKGLPDHDSKIMINQVYFRTLSPLRNKTEKHLVYGVVNDLKNIWKEIEEQHEKPKVGDMIEVHYSVPIELLTPVKHITHITYYTSYMYPCNPVFPPYNLDEIKKQQEDKGFKNEILFAECGLENITDDCIKYAGPLHNFYSDLPPRYGIKITRTLLVPDNNTETLIITTMDGEETEYKHNDTIS